jgi:hypothetical protein
MLQQDNKKYFSSITVVIAFMGFLFSSCKRTFSKPELFALDYPVATYANFENECRLLSK